MARPIARRGADPAGLQQWIKPQLTQLVDAAPDGPEWLHEIKFDGYRMHAHLERGAAADPHRARLDAQISGDRCGRRVARRPPGLSRLRRLHGLDELTGPGTPFGENPECCRKWHIHRVHSFGR
jgi:hypothetical protein